MSSLEDAFANGRSSRRAEADAAWREGSGGRLALSKLAQHLLAAGTSITKLGFSIFEDFSRTPERPSLILRGRFLRPPRGAKPVGVCAVHFSPPCDYSFPVRDPYQTTASASGVEEAAQMIAFHLGKETLHLNGYTGIGENEGWRRIL